MIKFRQIDIHNFVCFEHIVITPSIDPNKPLTIIRAENGSGKTSFLRATRWGMYGEQGLPGADTRTFSIHLADWEPDDEGMVTRVQIEFETDGSTRHHSASGKHTTRYNLTRRVTTVRKAARRDDEPDFQRMHERAHLMRMEPDGKWSPVPKPRRVIEELLPWGLREFFVMDADEAADFVGGSENKSIARREVVRKTTEAVQSLLGINVFKSATERVQAIGREFGAEATKAIGDDDLDALQQRLDVCRREESELKRSLAARRRTRRELSDRLRRSQDDLETEVKGVGAAEQLADRLSQTRRRQKRTSIQYQRVLHQIGGQLGSINLLATLARPLAEKAYGELKPLHDSGSIPLRHLQFVRDLFDTGVCICGQDLSADSPYRQQVERRITQTADQEKRAEYLAMVYDAADGFVREGLAAGWTNRTELLNQDVASLSAELAALKRERADIESDLDMIDQDKIQTIRDAIDALQKQLNTVLRQIATQEAALPEVVSKRRSLEKRINSRTRKERIAAEKRAASEIAGIVTTILTRAYKTIESDQVEELSRHMNVLFKQMAANVADGDLANTGANKATLRMIDEVGLRSVSHSGEYEIVAFNGRGRLMPPIEINGASRRVLALSFVLALCKASRTDAPLIADSLLNFMSGTVRRNTLLATAQNSRQPILLLTNSDLEGRDEAVITSDYSGATFTLTGQWDVVGPDGGDVLRATVRRKLALLCECGPREYCDVCERVGQSEMHGWSHRSNGVRK